MVDSKPIDELSSSLFWLFFFWKYKHYFSPQVSVHYINAKIYFRQDLAKSADIINDDNGSFLLERGTIH